MEHARGADANLARASSDVVQHRDRHTFATFPSASVQIRFRDPSASASILRSWNATGTCSPKHSRIGSISPPHPTQEAAHIRAASWHFRVPQELQVNALPGIAHACLRNPSACVHLEFSQGSSSPASVGMDGQIFPQIPRTIRFSSPIRVARRIDRFWWVLRCHLLPETARP